MKSYTLSGEWTLIKEEGENKLDFVLGSEKKEQFSIFVPHQYEQHKWKLDYAYSKAVSRYHGFVWYFKRFFAVESLSKDEEYILEFDRVSYKCEVYLNGEKVGEHKHSEERFSCPVTDVINYDKENILAVRVFEPVASCEAIEGIRLDQIPNGFWAGDEHSVPLSPIDSAGGILEDVRLVSVPKIRIEDIFVLPSTYTGEVKTVITVLNNTQTEQKIKIGEVFSTHKFSRVCKTEEVEFVAKKGLSECVILSAIPSHKLWEIDNPTLYLACVTLSSGSTKTVRFGFKDLRVGEHGYFMLNGKRIFLKCAHGVMSSETAIMMKANGFNAFRSIQQVMPEETLSLCDELGLLIIESPLTSWGMRWHENTEEMVCSSLCNMVKMHRNHACIGAYYLFNELRNCQTLQAGAKSLQRMREIAPNALVLLSSARWDLCYDLGSVANPYSDKFECLWGQEGVMENIERVYPPRFYAVSNLGMGDLHPYVFYPQIASSREWFKTAGKEGNPLFVSECGIGTQEHAMRAYFERIRLGSGKDSATVKEIKKVWDDVESFLSFYGMESVYPFATDIAKASDRFNGRQRRAMFDLIRSNPKINGFSLTSWCVGNEGAMEGVGVIKDTVSYAMQEGWAKLRWALFTDERVLYANKPFNIEAVLCNEDFLAPGKYKAQARIKGKDGIVWSKDFIADYPKDGHGGLPPLSATVLKERIELLEGEYTLSVRLLEGECPYGGEYTFKVIKPQAENLPKSVACWELNEKAVKYIRSNGVEVEELSESTNACTVLVGNVLNAEKTMIDKLFELAQKGANIVFVNIKFLENNPDVLKQIAGENAVCKNTFDWLYHFDSIHIRHPWFNRISDEGMLDLEEFSELYPRRILCKTQKASLTVCASLRVDAGCCATSLTVGEYECGKGKFVLNGFRIEDSLEKNPYAEQMLLNLISHYGKTEN